MKKVAAVLLLSVAFLAAPAGVLAGPVSVTMRVDGLSCPFCAYGLEKRLKKMEGVEDLKKDIDRGAVTVVYKDKKFFIKKTLSER